MMRIIKRGWDIAIRRLPVSMTFRAVDHAGAGVVARRLGSAAVTFSTWRAVENPEKYDDSCGVVVVTLASFS